MHYLSQNVKVPDSDREIVKISEINDGESCGEEGEKRDGWDLQPPLDNDSKLYQAIRSLR